MAAASALLPSSELRYYHTTYGDQYGYNERARKFHRHYGLVASPDDPKFAQGKPVDLATAPLFRRDHFNFRRDYPDHVEYSTQRLARELASAQTARAALLPTRERSPRPSTVDTTTSTRQPIYLWKPPTAVVPTTTTHYTSNGTPIAPHMNATQHAVMERQEKIEQQLKIRQQHAARLNQPMQRRVPVSHEPTYQHEQHIRYESMQQHVPWGHEHTWNRQHPSSVARSVDIVPSTSQTLTYTGDRPRTVSSHPLFGMRPIEVSTHIATTDRTLIPRLSTTLHTTSHMH